MSYLDSNQVLDPILRVLRGTFDFSGRAQRTDGVLYYIVASIAAVVPGFMVVGSSMSFDQVNLTMGAIGLLIQLPLVAWLVRRAHDYGLSGWWLLPFLLWMFTREPLATLANIDMTALRPSVVFQVVGAVVAVAFLCVVFWKPSEAENRFGPNPRFDAPERESVGTK